MAKAQRFRVEGTEEVVEAFHSVKRDFSPAEAAEAAGNALLPDVKRNTRVKTGALQAAWRVDRNDTGAEFINTVWYATIQEYGTDLIEPTHAVQRAWDENEQAILEAFTDEVERAGQSAGFSG